MRPLLWACAVLLATSACASPREAYLTVEVTYAEAAQGQWGLIRLQRNSGSEIKDGPFEISADDLRRRISIHAEDDELDAELELELYLCTDGDEKNCESSVMQLRNVFASGQVTELCFDFASMERGQLPETVDVREGSLPPGVSLCTPAQ